MDEGRMRFALTLAVAAALLFSFFVLKRFLGVMQFSWRAVVCLLAVAGIAALIWSKRFPPEDAPAALESAPLYQSQRDTFMNQ